MSRQVVTKAEFAAICGTDASAVSRWIKAGKISGKALVGEGRSARIDVEEAQRQLRIKLDSAQRLGNGLGTRLSAPQPTARSDDDEPLDRSAQPGEVDVADDELDAEIKREKLDQLRRANRRADIEEAAERGRYIETAAARRQLGVVAAQMLRVFEGAVPEFATAFAARFGCDEREATLFFAEQIRRVRTDASAKAAQAAAKFDAVLPDPDAPED